MATVTGGGQTTFINVGSNDANGVAQAHSVSLTWDPGSSDVVGYHVYRRTSDGDKMKKLTGPPILTTSYTDLTVEGGRTYFYAVSAIGAGESDLSFEVSAVIPFP